MKVTTYLLMVNEPVMVTSSAGIVSSTSLQPLKVYPSLKGGSGTTMADPYSVVYDDTTLPSTVTVTTYLFAVNVPMIVTLFASIVSGTLLHPLKVYPSLVGASGATIAEPYSSDSWWYTSPSTRKVMV